jgi:membrane protease YdiL (CAAX protease family)
MAPDDADLTTPSTRTPAPADTQGTVAERAAPAAASPGDPPARRPAEPPLRYALVRAVLGALVMGVGLGASVALGIAAADAWGLDGFLARLVPALLVTVLVVPTILFLRRRVDGRPLRGIGLVGPAAAARTAVAGFGVVLAAALLVVGGATAAGWVTWRAVEVGDLLLFLVSNTLVALLYEAVPEEVSLRGYVLTTLRSRYAHWVAVVVTTFLFVAAASTSVVVGAALTRLLGVEPFPWGAVPPGEDPVSYVMLLAVFGLMLAYARDASRTASVWTCVGAHLAFLTVNRVVLSASGTGVDVELASPDVLLLVPLYVGFAIVAFAFLGERAARPAARVRSGTA